MYLADILGLVRLGKQVLQGLNSGEQAVPFVVPCMLRSAQIDLVSLEVMQELKVGQCQHLNALIVQLLEDCLLQKLNYRGYSIILKEQQNYKSETAN